MTTRNLVDPELLPGLDVFPAFELTSGSLQQVREMSKQLRLLTPPSPKDASIVEREVRVPGPAGAPDVRVLVYAPVGQRQDKPAVLHVHGGGYVMGDPEMSEVRNRTWASQLGCVVASVDYRLPPESPHPGPVEDCYAALKWLHREAPRLGIDSQRIGIAGESAGGGLAAALALLARDRGEVNVAYQALVYPMLDDRTCVNSPRHPYTGEFGWTHDKNHFGWSCLLGCEPGSSDVSSYAVAARADDLSRLPPTFISVGTLDLFLEEDMEYARRLMRAGVLVELHVYPGAYHGFELFAPQACVTRQAVNDLASWLQRVQQRR